VALAQFNSQEVTPFNYILAMSVVKHGAGDHHIPRAATPRLPQLVVTRDRGFVV
jgi:hypothetical protein